jgi:hypothetical protein
LIPAHDDYWVCGNRQACSSKHAGQGDAGSGLSSLETDTQSVHLFSPSNEFGYRYFHAPSHVDSILRNGDNHVVEKRGLVIACNLLLVSGLSTHTDQLVVTYEGISFPEEDGWQREGTFDTDRWIENGWFWQAPELGVWAPGPFGEADFHRRSIAEFAAEATFFVEWVVQTDAPASILEVHGTPTVVSVYSNGAIYHFTFTDERVRVFRGSLNPEVYVDIAPSVPHTYRIELFQEALYIWYIDGQLFDSGTPMNPIPNDASGIIWGSRYQEPERDFPMETTRWNYLRYGVTPEDAGGDFDSDGVISLTDFYFLHECLINDRIGIVGGPENNSGPGCRFADFNSDSDTDLNDFADFQDQFSVQ